ncbi:MAG: hypothetical protein JW750_12065 [Anaerolineaceae bacterium]|nr:hypothetical protein [Anaerolineaceae bacterium]
MAAGKKKKGRIFVLIAMILIVGLAAVFILLRDQLLPTAPVEETAAEDEPVTQEGTVSVNTADIYVLQQPISRGQVVEERHLLKVAYPRERMIEGLFITNPADAIGKRALFDLKAGIPVTPNLLTSDTEGSFASFNIPKGYVAVSIPLEDSLGLTAVSYTLRPGDHVNVIGSMLFADLDEQNQTKLPNIVAPVSAPYVMEPETSPTGEDLPVPPPTLAPVTMQVNSAIGIPYVGRSQLANDLTVPGNDTGVWFYAIPSESQRPRLVSQSIIQNAIVLWIGDYPLAEEEEEQQTAAQEQVDAAATAAATTPEEEAAAQPTIEKPQTITLVVSPQDAVTLNYLMLSNAKLNIALRSAGDDERVNTESVTLQFIMQQYNIPLPSQLPYGIEPRIDSLNFYEGVPE